jgi:AraC-like DNA-binding protein
MLVSTRLLWNLASALATLGFDANAVLRLCGLTWQDLEEKEGDDRRLPLDAVHSFWHAAVAVTGDENIGVRVGALARVETFGVLGYIGRSSATLGDALLKTARYIRLWNAATGLSLLVEGDDAVLWYRSLAPERPHPAGGDTVMTSLLVLSRQLTGRHVMPSEARFAHPAPSNDAPYREIFGSSAKFDRSEYGLVFRPDILTLPITTFDSELGERLTQEASALVDALPVTASFSRRVRALLTAELRGGNPLSENIAAQLGVHPKTLTRRLRDEGTSHRELLDTLRRELAERYVSASELNVSEVAFLLGFSDTSAFNKAFKRWFGVAPVAFRRSAQS